MVDGYSADFRPGSAAEAHDIVFEIGGNERSKWEAMPPEGRDELRGLREVTSETLDNPTHVLPELLQNADDIGGACTEVSIELTEDMLVFRNHEEPMAVENVEALGAYTKSTKQGDLDSIGHFGIGFKTVFSLTESVYVHSGFFSFRYTAEDKTVPEPVACAEQPATDDEYYDGTTVALPLTAEAKKNRREILEEQLSSIGSLLPFLNHIDTITVSVFGEQQTFHVTPAAPGGVEITCEQEGEQISSERLRIFADSFKPDEELLGQIADKRNLDTDTLRQQTPDIEIEVAVPLDADGAPESLDTSHLFCYFATEPDTQLPFHIQADFSLKPDRKHILWPDEFNRALLAQVADVFETAFVQFHGEQADPSRILELVPDPTQDRTPTPYVDSVVEDIAAFVRSEACIPDASQNLFQPAEVLFFASPFRDLFSETDVRNVIDRPVRYPSKDISDTARSRLQSLVPDSRLTIEAFLKQCAAEQFTSRSTEWYIRFYAGIMRHWNSKYESSGLGSPGPETRKAQRNFLKVLRQTACLPVEDGTVTALATGEESLYRLSKTKQRDLNVFTADDGLTLLDTELVATLQHPPDKLRKDASLARDLLFDTVLEIPELEPEDIVRDVINPAFEQNDLTADTADRYVQFIAQGTKSLRDAADITLRVRGDDSTTPSARPPETLYLGPEYVDAYDTDVVFGVFDQFSPVSNHYLDMGELSQEEWITVLTQLGVHERLTVETEDPWDSDRFTTEEGIRTFLEEHGDDVTDVHPEDSLDAYNGQSTKWRWMKRENKRGSVRNFKYALIDQHLPAAIEEELRELTSKTTDEATAYWFEFFKMLDEWWDSYYEEKVYRVYKYSERKAKFRVRTGECYCPSSFGTFLQESKVVPGSDGAVHQARDVFVRNAQTEDKPVTFIFSGISSTDIFDFLDLQRTPGIRVTINQLTQVIENSRQNPEDAEPRNIASEIRKQLWAITDRLPEDADSLDQDIIDRLQDLPFLFIRNADTQFRTPAQVTWTGQQLGDYLVPVSDTYPDAWDLLQTLGVKHEPELLDYITYLGQEPLSESTESIERTDAFDAWWEVLQAAVYIPNDQCDGPTDPLPEATELLRDQGALLTAANTLSGYEAVEFYSNDASLLPELPPEIQRRVLHPERNQRYTAEKYEQRLAQLTDTRPLHDGLREELTSEIPEDARSETFSDAYPQILNAAHSYLQSTTTNGAAQIIQLAQYTLYWIDELTCKYFIDGEYQLTTHDTRCFIDNDNRRIILREDSRTEFALIDALIRELNPSPSDQTALTPLLKGAAGKSDAMLRAFLEDSEYAYHPLPHEKKDGTDSSTDKEESDSDNQPVTNSSTAKEHSATIDAETSETSTSSESEDSTSPDSTQEQETDSSIQQTTTGQADTSKINSKKTSSNSPTQSLNHNGDRDTGHGRGSGGGGGGGGFGSSSENKTEIGNQGEAFILTQLRRHTEDFFRTNGRLDDSVEDTSRSELTIHGESNRRSHTVKITDVSATDCGYDILLQGAKIAKPETTLKITEVGDELRTLIEVKGSKHDNITEFTLTSNEYTTAVQNQRDYAIIRVYKVLSENPYVHRIFDQIPKLTSNNDIEYSPSDIQVKYDH